MSDEGRVWSTSVESSLWRYHQADHGSYPRIIQSMDNNEDSWWSYILFFSYTKQGYVIRAVESHESYRIPKNWIIV